MHESFAKLATKLIAANGRPVVLVRFTDGAGSWDSEPGEEYTTVLAVQDSFTEDEMASGALQVHDVVYLIDAGVAIDGSMHVREYPDTATLPPVGEWSSAAPSPGTATVDYSIVDTGHEKPGTRSIMYRIHGRV